MNKDNELFGASTEGKEINFIGLVDGEVVEIMLLERSIPKSYLEKLEKENKEKRDEVEAMGLEYKDKEPNIRDSGIVWKYVIMSRNKNVPNSEPIEKVIDVTHEGITIPNYSCFGQIFIPSLIDMSKQKFSQRVGMNNSNFGVPTLDFIPANSQVCTDWKTKVKATDIRSDQREQYANLIKLEHERREKWTNALKNWEMKDSESAKYSLDEYTARLLMLCRLEGKKFIYTTPRKGIIFKAGIRRTPKTNMFNIIAYKWIDEPTAYSSGFYKFFNMNLAKWNDITEPTDSAIELADRIIKQRDIDIEKRRIEKEMKTKETGELPEPAWLEEDDNKDAF